MHNFHQCSCNWFTFLFRSIVFLCKKSELQPMITKCMITISASCSPVDFWSDSTIPLSSQKGALQLYNSAAVWVFSYFCIECMFNTHCVLSAFNNYTAQQLFECILPSCCSATVTPPLHQRGLMQAALHHSTTATEHHCIRAPLHQRGFDAKAKAAAD